MPRVFNNTCGASNADIHARALRNWLDGEILSFVCSEEMSLHKGKKTLQR